MKSTMARNAERNFILQQGLAEPEEETCEIEFSALQFQPRIIGSLVFLGIIMQLSSVFLALAVVLWWSALLPRWNPFDAIYNVIFGRRPDAYRLTPAPAPRRYASGMSGTFALVIGILLRLDYSLAAYILETVFMVAVIATVFGKFCLPAFTYHVSRGNIEFARKTLPWAMPISQRKGREQRIQEEKMIA